MDYEKIVEELAFLTKPNSPFLGYFFENSVKNPKRYENIFFKYLTVN
jgi:hypothetical protein